MAVQYQIIYWRDIPVQLRVRVRRSGVTRPLTERFQKTVYRAAYRGKAITGDPFQEAWHTRGWLDYEGAETDLERVAALLAAELEAAYDDERLNTLALNKGFEEKRT